MKFFLTSIYLLCFCTLQFNCTKKPKLNIAAQNKLYVYPNPCNKRCDVSCTNLIGTNYTLGIIGTDGKEFMNITVDSASTVRLQLDDKPNGKYIAYLSNGTYSYSETFYKFD
jgi:hypothetical protein